MVSEWLCLSCKSKFYSTNEQRDKEYVSCATCGEEVANPYFEEKSSSGHQPGKTRPG